MAKATVVRAEAPVEKVTLELSHEEAQALANILGLVTDTRERAVGNPPGATYPIYRVLVAAGYTHVCSGW